MHFLLVFIVYNLFPEHWMTYCVVLLFFDLDTFCGSYFSVHVCLVVILMTSFFLILGTPVKLSSESVVPSLEVVSNSCIDMLCNIPAHHHLDMSNSRKSGSSSSALCSTRDNMFS